tara:strand:+ start:246 stop:1013 length:768 start_codon:yes stop_codon:yes gene_type:complete
MIHIFTSVVNRPEFVIIQNKLFKKFLKNEYKFHIIDDSIDNKMTEQFRNICSDNDLQYYKTPKELEHSNPSTKVGNVIQWAFDNIIKKCYASDIIFWLDSDMFLIDDFDIEEYVSDCIIAGVPQHRGHIKYMWNAIMFFNMPKLIALDPDINFNVDYIDGHHLDTGGETYHYFKRNNIEMKPVDANGAIYPTHFNNIDLQKDAGGYNMELHLDGKFLHYRAASNWHSNWRSSDDPLNKKTEIFNTIINDVLEDNV